jgi:hypothetical protein
VNGRAHFAQFSLEPIGGSSEKVNKFNIPKKTFKEFGIFE